MLARMLGAARLNVATFEDVEHDSGATLQAMLAVILVSIATGVGTLLAGEADLLRMWSSECCAHCCPGPCGHYWPGSSEARSWEPGIPRQIGVSWLGEPGLHKLREF